MDDSGGLAGIVHLKVPHHIGIPVQRHGTADDLVSRAKRLYEMGFTRLVPLYVERALMLDRDNVPAAVLAARLGSGDQRSVSIAEARALWEASGAKDAGMLAAEMNLGDGRTGDARAILESLLVTTSRDPGVLRMMGRVLDDQGSTDEALAYYEEAGGSVQQLRSLDDLLKKRKLDLDDVETLASGYADEIMDMDQVELGYFNLAAMVRITLKQYHFLGHPDPLSRVLEEFDVPGSERERNNIYFESCMAAVEAAGRRFSLPLLDKALGIYTSLTSKQLSPQLKFAVTDLVDQVTSPEHRDDLDEFMELVATLAPHEFYLVASVLIERFTSMAEDSLLGREFARDRFKVLLALIKGHGYEREEKCFLGSFIKFLMYFSPELMDIGEEDILIISMDLARKVSTVEERLSVLSSLAGFASEEGLLGHLEIISAEAERIWRDPEAVDEGMRTRIRLRSELQVDQNDFWQAWSNEKVMFRSTRNRDGTEGMEELPVLDMRPDHRDGPFDDVLERASLDIEYFKVLRKVGEISDPWFLLDRVVGNLSETDTSSFVRGMAEGAYSLVAEHNDGCMILSEILVRTLEQQVWEGDDLPDPPSVHLMLQKLEDMAHITRTMESRDLFNRGLRCALKVSPRTVAEFTADSLRDIESLIPEGFLTRIARALKRTQEPIPESRDRGGDEARGEEELWDPEVETYFHLERGRAQLAATRGVPGTLVRHMRRVLRSWEDTDVWAVGLSAYITGIIDTVPTEIILGHSFRRLISDILSIETGVPLANEVLVSLTSRLTDVARWGVVSHE